MREYFIALALSSLAISVALAIAHDGLKSSVRSALGAVLLAVALSPLSNLALGFKDFEIPELAQLSEHGKIEVYTEQIMEETIAEAVAEHFGVRGGVSADCHDFDFETLRSSRVDIWLSGEALFLDYGAVKSFVEENFSKEGGCKIEVFKN